VDILDRVGRLLGVIKSITDPVDVSDRAARSLGITAGDLSSIRQMLLNATAITATKELQLMRNAGVSYGASFSINSPQVAGTAVQVVAPGANTNGLIVWVANFLSIAAVLQVCNLIAKATAPTTSVDGDVLCIASATSSVVTSGSVGRVDAPIFVPAGKGLYLYILFAETATTHPKSVLYTLLS